MPNARQTRRQSLIAEVEGALFDLDDSLTLSTQLAHKVWTERLKLRRCDFSLFPYDTVIGCPNRFAAEEIIRFFGLQEDPGALTDEVERRFIERTPLELDPRPGADHVLRVVKAARIKRALVTNGTRGHVDLVFARFGWSEYFDAVVTSETEGLEGIKPHPAPYTHAAGLLKTRPHRCFALEDSVIGARSAQAAGVAVIFGAPHAHSPPGPLERFVTHMLPDLNAFNLGLLFQ